MKKETFSSALPDVGGWALSMVFSPRQKNPTGVAKHFELAHGPVQNKRLCVGPTDTGTSAQSLGVKRHSGNLDPKLPIFFCSKNRLMSGKLIFGLAPPSKLILISER